MANNTCLSSIQACRLRVARLDDGGNLMDGVGNMYVTDQLISIASTPENEAGDEINQKNGCGDLIVTSKDPDKLKRVGLATSLGALDAELLEMMTGATVITVGGDTVGLALPDDQTVAPRVSVEAWSKAWDVSAQATDGTDALYYQWVWPSTTWTLGAHTLENGVLVVPLTGNGVKNPNWGAGPDGDFPITIPGPEAYILTTNLPDAECGYQEMVLAGS